MMRERDNHRAMSYAFITTDPRETRTVLRAIAALKPRGCSLTVEHVIGEYDLIVKIGGPDIDSLGHAIFDGIQDVPGVFDVVVAVCITQTDEIEHAPSGAGLADVVSVTHS